MRSVSDSFRQGSNKCMRNLGIICKRDEMNDSLATEVSFMKRRMFKQAIVVTETDDTPSL